jgi:hypothetical protein
MRQQLQQPMATTATGQHSWSAFDLLSGLLTVDSTTRQGQHNGSSMFRALALYSRRNNNLHLSNVLNGVTLYRATDSTQPAKSWKAYMWGIVSFACVLCAERASQESGGGAGNEANAATCSSSASAFPLRSLYCSLPVLSSHLRWVRDHDGECAVLLARLSFAMRDNTFKRSFDDDDDEKKQPGQQQGVLSQYAELALLSLDAVQRSMLACAARHEQMVESTGRQAILRNVDNCKTVGGTRAALQCARHVLSQLLTFFQGTLLALRNAETYDMTPHVMVLSDVRRIVNAAQRVDAYVSGLKRTAQSLAQAAHLAQQRRGAAHNAATPRRVLLPGHSAATPHLDFKHPASGSSSSNASFVTPTRRGSVTTFTVTAPRNNNSNSSKNKNSASRRVTVEDAAKRAAEESLHGILRRFAVLQSEVHECAVESFAEKLKLFWFIRLGSGGSAAVSFVKPVTDGNNGGGDHDDYMHTVLTGHMYAAFEACLVLDAEPLLGTLCRRLVESLFQSYTAHLLAASVLVNAHGAARMRRDAQRALAWLKTDARLGALFRRAPACTVSQTLFAQRVAVQSRALQRLHLVADVLEAPRTREWAASTHLLLPDLDAWQARCCCRR